MAEPTQAVLPLFPLAHVLMPGCALPLRIFEPRYRQLLADITSEAGERRFGVVALLAGSEVESRWEGAAARFAGTGTVAELIEVRRASDGTATVLTGGSQRFRVRTVLAGGTPYLRARVEYLPEPAGDLSPALLGSAQALAEEYARLLVALGAPDPRSGAAAPDEPVLRSYRLADEAPLSDEDRQRLLEDDTAAARLLHVQRVLRRELILLRRTRSVAVPPRAVQLGLRPN